MSPESVGPRDLVRAHGTFLETGEVATGLRSVVAQSWLRSAAAGVDAEKNLAPIALGSAELADYRAEHRLSQVFPLLYDVLGRIAEDCDCLMALGDERGQLLWVCGHPAALRAAESINFTEGAVWNESTAGTNAPGTALRLDAPVMIHAGEHFNRLVQPWSCAAAPIHDPATQAIIGILDVTGGADVGSPQTLGMVRAAARMAEIELARLSAVDSSHAAGSVRSGRWPSSPPPALRQSDRILRVQALGRPDCVVTFGGRAVQLSPRHSEIMIMLVERAGGLTGDELEIEVYPADVQRSTMRAEMARLRSLLGGDSLESRPYRLVVQAGSDWQTVAAHLAAGRVRDAFAAYRGPLLPQSEAPGVVELRDSLQHDLRAAVLRSGLPELMVAWTRTRWGADDLAMWRRQAELLPASSPLRGLAATQTVRLEHQFGR